MTWFFGVMLVVVLPIVFGTRMARPYHSLPGWSGSLAAGTITGLTLYPAVCFLFYAWFGMSWSTLLLGAVSLWALHECVRRMTKGRLRESVTLGPGTIFERIVRSVLGFFLLLLCWIISSEVIEVSANGVGIGFQNQFGDLPLHLHIASSFLFGENFPPQNPIFSGVPLRYPFLSDFYSAIIWKATGKLEWAFELPGFLYLLSFLTLILQGLGRLAGSKRAGLFSLLLIFFSGSMGWVAFVKERFASSSTTEWFPHTYGMWPEGGFYWANLFHALWVPQRGLQVALPLGLLGLLVVLDAARRKDPRQFLFAALLLLPLPYFHGHAAMALGLIGFVLLWFYPSFSWTALALPLTLVWIPQMAYLAQWLGPKVVGGKSFFARDLAWQCEPHEFFWFWWKNLGLFIPLAVFGFTLAKKELRVIAGGGLLVFVVANVFRFAPWEWDNIKLLIYWFLCSVPLVALALDWFWKKKKLWSRSLALLLLFSLIASGALDLSRALRPGGEDHQVLSASDLKVAAWLREHVPAGAVIVAHPTFNQPLVLSGHSLVLGYPGHIWSHGLPLEERENAIKSLARGELSAFSTLRDWGATHILVGPQELANGFQSDFFQHTCPLVGSVESSAVYLFPSPDSP